MNIPVIAVFTKYDQLVNEQHLNAHKKKANLSESEAEENAKNYFVISLIAQDVLNHSGN